MSEHYEDDAPPVGSLTVAMAVAAHIARMEASIEAERQIEALAEMARDIAGLAYEPPHADNRCARCGGPVLLTSCAREGGCRTAAERVAVRERLAKITCSIAHGEKEWAVSDGVVTGYGPCTGFGELGFGHALAAWREKALAAERGR